MKRENFMQRKRQIYMAIHLGLTAALAVFGGLVYAAEPIQNPEVRARVEVMQGFKTQTKLLSDMATGAQSFDAEAVETAIKALQDGATKVSAVFRPHADDPASQALPDIWSSPAEFRQKVTKLGRVAGDLDGADAAALGETLEPVMAVCKDCHGRFKLQ